MADANLEKIAELHDAALDLYEKTSVIAKLLISLAPSMIALKGPFEAYDPQLAKLYFDHLNAAKTHQLLADIQELQPLIAEAIQTLKSHAN
jgi:hypothetical protein